MPDLPSSLALTNISDGSTATAAPVRNNFSAIQTAVNALITALSGGTAGQTIVYSDADTIAPGSAGALTKIADTTLGADAADITFSAIPGTYAHLIVEIYARSAKAAIAYDTFHVRFNGDTAANYDSQLGYATGGTPSAAETLAGTSGRIGWVPAATAPADVFGAAKVTVPHYAGAKQKTAHTQGTSKHGTGSGDIWTTHSAVFWRSSAVITSLTILAAGGNLLTGTRVTLYGVSA